MSTSSGSASLPGPDSLGCPSRASRSVQSTRAGRLLAGTSRTTPAVQYADTWPSASASTTASGPFANRGSAPTGAPVGAAFFAPGACDVDDGLVARDGRGAAA
ncbi:hypothetical protein STENM327S_06562 [Streptomyces tendae]